MSFYATVDKEATIEKIKALGDMLPTPVGYQMLVVKPVIEEKTESGIIKPSEFLKKEEAGSVLGLVVKMGDMCYLDEGKFPTGPWVQEGDFILIGAYRGARFSVAGQEFIMIHDDMPLGVVKNPSGINRAY